MRRILAIAVISVLALSWAAGFAPGKQLPSCCKVHHCSMKKQCGIGTAPAVEAAKIYTVLCNVFSVAPRELSFDAIPLAASHLPVAPKSDIDHPPRLLLV